MTTKVDQYTQRLLPNKNTRFAYLLLLLVITGSSCKKDNPGDGNPATIQIFNALNDKIQLYVNLSGKPLTSYNLASFVDNKVFSRWNNQFIREPEQTLGLFAIPDTLSHSQPLVSHQLDVTPGKIYTMFVYGNRTNAGYLFKEEQFPVLNYTDSSTFFRFVNMSNGAPVSVNLKGEPAGSLVDELAFKSVSEFEPLAFNRTIGRREFEIRDKATGTVLTTYITPVWNTSFLSYNSWVFKPVTLVFTGVPQGTGENLQKVVPMPHIVF